MNDSLRIIPHPDRTAFLAWFLRAYPQPRSKAQRSYWKARQTVAWRAWQGARATPYVEMPPCSLTETHIEPLSPMALIEMAERERR